MIQVRVQHNTGRNKDIRLTIIHSHRPRTLSLDPFLCLSLRLTVSWASNIQHWLRMRRRAASERGLMSAGKGFGKLESPDVYSPLGVISRPSGPTALRMSIVAASDAIAIHTLRIPRKRPGQILPAPT